VSTTEFDLRSFMERQPWRELANCRGLDPEMFHPHKTEEGNRQSAITVCRACDVQAECLAYALNAGESLGIWGGKTERARRQIRRRAALQLGGSDRGPIAGDTERRIEHGTNHGYHACARRNGEACGPCKRAHADEKYYSRPSRAQEAS
jgi:WhiB family redox-sensing transcriptional regulator